MLIRGNNHWLIERVLGRRREWKQIHYTNRMFHFKWQGFSRGIKFESLSAGGGQSVSAVNHFEFHHELTTKDLLYKNLHQYCEVISFAILTDCAAE